MSGQAPVARIRDRLAGKWQIPLLAVSVGLLVAGLVQIKPPQGRVPLDTLLERISAAIDGRMYDLALSDADQLLAYLQRERPEVNVGPVYLQRARALALKAQAQDARDPDTGRQVLEAYDLASNAAQQFGWVDHRNRARAYEWLGSWDRAMAAYEQAAAAESPRRLDFKKRIVELMVLAGVGQGQREAALDELIDLSTERLDMLYWAVDAKIDLLTRRGEAEEALALLDRLAPIYEAAPVAHRFGYLRGLALYKASRLDEAEAALRDLRNRLVLRDEVHAMSGWLLGRVVLFDDGPQRPEEALSFFRDVVSSHTGGVYVDASHLGMAEALAILERYPESLEQFNVVIAALPDYEDSDLVNRDAVRLAMSVVADGLRSLGEFEPALAFLEPAAGLVDGEQVDRLTGYLERLGTWRALLAGQWRDQADEAAGHPSQGQRAKDLALRSSGMFSSAADAFLEVARINTLREARSASATWRAAELLDEAGDQERTIEVLSSFVRRRPGSNLAPRALHRLGQSYQALGRYAEAVEAYQENLSRFARTPDAGSGLIPLATCFIALGGDYFDQAEKTLRLILDDSPIFTPQAPEFADALFLLGDLMSRTGRFEDAIPLLSEAKQRYPEDHRSLRAEFLLADAYRQSGLGLRQDLSDPKFVGERDRLVAESSRRIGLAAKLFGQLVEKFEDGDESDLSELQSLHLRYARLYEADCWYELGRYELALQKYERAAWIYRDSPSALAAYTQIINCHSRLGKPRDARAALRRAEYLLSTMAQTGFGDPALTGGREEWEQYFRWLNRAELF